MTGCFNPVDMYWWKRSLKWCTIEIACWNVIAYLTSWDHHGSIWDPGRECSVKLSTTKTDGTWDFHRSSKSLFAWASVTRWIAVAMTREKCTDRGVKQSLCSLSSSCPMQWSETPWSWIRPHTAVGSSKHTDCQRSSSVSANESRNETATWNQPTQTWLLHKLMHCPEPSWQ